jgi:ribonuclease BN (tRNA processing enzyme)
MKVRVLGCSGGIGGRHLRTTSLLLDHDVLIDAGTGVEELSLGELKAIDHVFLTHSHLDHIASLPMLVDTVGEMRSQPLTVYALQETIDILRTHIFNWLVWPDFTEIPNAVAPFLRFKPIKLGETHSLGGRRITVVPANHTVPAVGYHLDSGRGSLVFTGDTGVNDALWPLVNAIENLRFLIIETAFPNAQRDLALMSKHLCPETLSAELAKLKRVAEIYITHLKPGHIEDTMAEIESLAAAYQPSMLQNCQIFDF